MKALLYIWFNNIINSNITNGVKLFSYLPCFFFFFVFFCCSFLFLIFHNFYSNCLLISVKKNTYFATVESYLEFLFECIFYSLYPVQKYRFLSGFIIEMVKYLIQFVRKKSAEPLTVYPCRWSFKLNRQKLAKIKNLNFLNKFYNIKQQPLH